MIERYALRRGYDGVGVFGADVFPVKRPLGGYITPEWGRSMSIFECTTRALLYPGPDGPVATERFETFREGLQLCEAIICVRRAIAQDRLSAGLRERAERHLGVKGERETASERGWFGARYMQAEEDARLFELAEAAALDIRK